MSPAVTLTGTPAMPKERKGRRSRAHPNNSMKNKRVGLLSLRQSCFQSSLDHHDEKQEDV